MRFPASGVRLPPEGEESPRSVGGNFRQRVGRIGPGPAVLRMNALGVALVASLVRKAGGSVEVRLQDGLEVSRGELLPAGAELQFTALEGEGLARGWRIELVLPGGEVLR